MPSSPPPTVSLPAAPPPHHSVVFHSVFVYLGSGSHTGKLMAELVCVPLVTQSPFSVPPPYPGHTPQADISQISVTPVPGTRQLGTAPCPKPAGNT